MLEMSWSEESGVVRETIRGVIPFALFDTMSGALGWIEENQASFPGTRLEIRNPRGTARKHTWTVVCAIEEATARLGVHAAHKKEVRRLEALSAARPKPVTPNLAPYGSDQVVEPMGVSKGIGESPRVELPVAVRAVLDTMKELRREGTGGVAAEDKGTNVYQFNIEKGSEKHAKAA